MPHASTTKVTIEGNPVPAYNLRSGIATRSVRRSESQDRDTAASGGRMKHEDAMEFLERVRDIFSDRPFIYNSFLGVMKEFKEQTITTDGVIDRVKVLFRGHSDLLQGFNMFLPPACRIRVEAESPPTTAHAEVEDKKAQQFASAYKYVNKVKKRFKAAPHTYKEFLTVLQKYQMVHRSVDLVNTQITRLFRSHPDLLSDFVIFLPERRPSVDKTDQ
jgi:paired amphipathic helix protein Sin3a